MVLMRTSRILIAENSSTTTPGVFANASKSSLIRHSDCDIRVTFFDHQTHGGSFGDETNDDFLQEFITPAAPIIGVAHQG